MFECLQIARKTMNTTKLEELEQIDNAREKWLKAMEKTRKILPKNFTEIANSHELMNTYLSLIKPPAN